MILGLAAPVAALAESSGGWTQGLAAAGEFGLPASGDGIYGIIYNLLAWLLAIFGLVGIIGFTISGIMYLTAAGDSGRMETAKNAMYYSIIGVIVGLSGLVVLYAATYMLTGNYIF